MLNIFGSKVPQISAEDVKKAIDTQEKFILLDVRTEEEYSKRKITGSINLPLDQVAEKISKIIPEKDATIYTYCLSGNRSESAAQILLKLGYAHVKSMTSGLLAWNVKGYKLD